MAVKTKLGWVLMGGRKPIKREGSCNFLCDNSSSTIDFWSLESYETLPKLSSEMLPPDEKISVNTLSLKKLLLSRIKVLRKVYYGKVILTHYLFYGEKTHKMIKVFSLVAQIFFRFSLWRKLSIAKELASRIY